MDTSPQAFEVEGSRLLATIAADSTSGKGDRGASSALAHENLGAAARLQAQGGQFVVVLEFAFNILYCIFIVFDFKLILKFVFLIKLQLES